MRLRIGELRADVKSDSPKVRTTTPFSRVSHSTVKLMLYTYFLLSSTSVFGFPGPPIVPPINFHNRPSRLIVSEELQSIAPLPNPTILSRFSDSGYCVFDAGNQSLSVYVGSVVYTSGRLNTPIFSDGRPGIYTGIYCGESRTLLFTDHSVVVTLGRDAVIRGDTTLPGELFAAFERHTLQQLGSQPIASVGGDRGEFALQLGENGRLFISDVTTRDSYIWDITRFLEFQIDRISRRPYMYYFGDRLYIVQLNSRRVIEINITAENPLLDRVHTFEAPIICASEPIFSEARRRLNINFGNSTFSISPGHGIVH